MGTVLNAEESNSTAVVRLLGAGRTQIDHAIEDLREYDYVRDQQVVVEDEEGALLIRDSHETHFSGPPNERLAEILDRSSEGTGSAAFWEEYARGPALEDTLEWSTRLLPGDPLILSKQGPAYYRYAVLSDTVVGGVAITRIEAQLMSDTERQGIQTARFYIDSNRDELVGFRLLFAHRSLLFDEESRFSYLLAPGPDGRWLPLKVDVNTFLNLPLSKGQRFKFQARYSDTVPVSRR